MRTYWWEKYEVRSQLAIDMFTSHQRQLWFQDDDECALADRRYRAWLEDQVFDDEDLPF